MSVAAPAGRPSPLTLMMQQQPYVGSSSSSGYGGYGGGASSSRVRGAAASSGDGEEDEEEEEEEEKAGRMLGFMFGNVDDTGDLDVEYLDQDAKEHLSALADQLGPSLVDLEAKQLSTSASLGDQEDYDQKADDAVDYEDIDEACEDDGQLLPDETKSKFYSQVALATIAKPPQAEEEENYDEDDEAGAGDDGVNEDDDDEEEIVVEPVPIPVPVPVPVVCLQSSSDAFLPPKPVSITPAEKLSSLEVVPQKPADVCVQNLDADSCIDTADDEWDDDDDDDFDFDDEPLEEYSGDEDETPEFQLPVIFEEHGKKVLQFSEIFGAKQECWRLGNKKLRSKRSFYKGRHGKFEAMLDSDEAQALKVVPEDFDLAEFHLLESDERESQQLLEGDDEELAGRFKHLSCEPLNRKLSEIRVLEGSFAANFDPIHQLDWEKGIVWDIETSMRLQEDDSESESTERRRRQMTPAEPASRGERMIVLEPLSRQTSGEKSSSKRLMRHPQMLRLELWRQQAGGESLKKIERILNEGDARNSELASGAWLEGVCWDQPDTPRTTQWKATLDLTDSHMVFEVAETRETKAIRDHAAAMVISPRTGKGKTPDISELNVPFRFNISNDKYYSVKKSTPQQKLQTKKRAVHGSVKVVHSVPALRLQTMKPKLTNKDLANFHRPKATWFPHHNEVAAKEQGAVAVRGPMKVIVKPLGAKGSKLHVDASDTLDTFSTKAAKKLGDWKPSEKAKVIFAGKELQEGKTFAEQKVPPNSILHLIRSKVHIWKPQALPGENKPTRPPGAFKKKSELSVRDGHVALMEYCEERPLILSNVGMGAVLSTYYRKTSAADNPAMAVTGPWKGVILPLEPAEESPFLGNIRLKESQSCLETNMYRAPVFQHQVRSTDFLLVRSPKGKLSLRRIDSVNVVGQQEPHIEVMAPSSKTVHHYLGNRLQAYVYREFRGKEQPGVLPMIAADELQAHFPTLSDGLIRKRLKNIADLQRGPNGDLRWVMRKGFRVPSEEELRRLVTPENVCSFESMQAGIHHLKRMGVQKLTQHVGVAAATNDLPDEALALAAATHIERELQVTPWNLSANFVSATMQGRSIEKLEIEGTGDPTGRGLGFSYLRMAVRPANTGAIVEKKAAAARGGGAVTGTDADLRRLSMEAAREVLLKFKVSDADIEKLTRWHRIALVRKLSSEQAAVGGADVKMNLNKYARGNSKLPAVHQQQQVKVKCQEIWDRQAASLSAIDGDDSDEESLDDFAGDLENLLEAEEDDAAKAKEKKRENVRGVGRKKALQAQMEEDMEDEAAEAAELHRMLMEDDEAEEEQKRKNAMNEKSSAPATPAPAPVQVLAPAPTQVAATPLPVILPGFGSVVQQPGGVQASNGQANPNRPKMKKRVLKRTFNRRNQDGTITKEVEIINDPIEVERYLARKREREAAAAKNNAIKLSQKKVPAKDLKEKKAMNSANKNAGTKARDTKLVICGGCGQVGHMRTNKKKCPLYSGGGGGGGGAPAARPESEVVDRPVPKLTIKKPVPDTPKLRVKFTSLDALSKEAAVPPPPPPPPPKPVATANGHGGRVVKIKIKLNPEAEVERPAIPQEVERERIDLGVENHRVREASPVPAGYEASPAREEFHQHQHQQQAAAEVEPGVEGERKRQGERPEETHKKKKKHKKEHKKERQKEKDGGDLERRMLLEERRLQEEREGERIRAIQLQEQQQRQEQQRRVAVLAAQQARHLEPPKRSIVIKHKKRPPPTTHYESPEPAAKRQRKRGGGEVEIANILEEVVEKMRQADCSYLFLKPVTKKEAPDYHYYIKKPMDLSTIRDRVRRLQYKSREDFLTDVQLIVDNAHTYNDNRNPGIPPLADRLFEVCEELLEQRELQLCEIEERIEEEDERQQQQQQQTPTTGAGRKRSLKTL